MVAWLTAIEECLKFALDWFNNLHINTFKKKIHLIDLRVGPWKVRDQSRIYSTSFPDKEFAQTWTSSDNLRKQFHLPVFLYKWGESVRFYKSP